MVKLLDKPVCKLLKIKFENYLKICAFPESGKKLFLYPFTKKGDKKTVKIYYSVSYSPLCLFYVLYHCPLEELGSREFRL